MVLELCRLTFIPDQLEPPCRNLMSPLRLPISNVFKGQSSGIAVSGRVCAGVVQVGEHVRVLPGDETAVIKSEFKYCHYGGILICG